MSTDIDIDVADREKALAGLTCVEASKVQNGQRQRHNTGIYFQDVPVDPIDGYCSILFKEAADLGYFKIDVLPNTIYTGVRNEDHLNDLLNREPEWALLESPEFVSLLVHVHSHFDIVEFVKPRSIEDLSVAIALIRPGKRHLIGKPRHVVDADIWTKPTTDEYWFKKPHAVAYAASIVVQMNLLVEQNS